MSTLKPNNQLLNEVYFDVPNLNDKIVNGFNEFYYYLESFKDEEFIERQNEEISDAIKRAESIFFSLEEMIKRSAITNKRAIEAVYILNKMSEYFNAIAKNTQFEKEKFVIKNNVLIDKILELEERKTNDLIQQNPKGKNELKGKLEDKKDEWEHQRINFEEESSKRFKDIIDLEEIQKIDEWSELKLGNILFDSTIDDWKKETSVFDLRILNKSNLLFIIEDIEGNKFGGYINTIIDKYDVWITDPKSFVFSLRSNGRLTGMLKFDIAHPQYAFYLGYKSFERLFSFGQRDIRIFKEDSVHQSYCIQQYFNYKGNPNALCGKTDPEKFTLKRITIIQLF